MMGTTATSFLHQRSQDVFVSDFQKASSLAAVPTVDVHSCKPWQETIPTMFVILLSDSRSLEKRHLAVFYYQSTDGNVACARTVSSVSTWTADASAQHNNDDIGEINWLI